MAPISRISNRIADLNKDGWLDGVFGPSVESAVKRAQQKLGLPMSGVVDRRVWLGLLGFVPLPTKWYIDIGEPIPVDSCEPGADNDSALVSQLGDQVRNLVQEMIYDRLAQRKSVFFG